MIVRAFLYEVFVWITWSEADRCKITCYRSLSIIRYNPFDYTKQLYFSLFLAIRNLPYFITKSTTTIYYIKWKYIKDDNKCHIHFIIWIIFNIYYMTILTILKSINGVAHFSLSNYVMNFIFVFKTRFDVLSSRVNWNHITNHKNVNNVLMWLQYKNHNGE